MTAFSRVKVIKPALITDAVLWACSVPEDEYSEWDGGASYPLDAMVQVAAEHAVYRSKVTNNQAKVPSTSPDQWKRVGATNRWAMFDEALNTATTSTSGIITMILKPGRVGGVALFGVTAATVLVELKDLGTGDVLYSRQVSVADQFISSWYEYFFSPLGTKGDVLLTDVPSASNSALTITITGTGTVSVRSVVVGALYTLGWPDRGLGARRINTSRVTTDDDNVTIIDRRPSTRQTDIRFSFETTRLNAVLGLLDDLEDVVCAWIAVDHKGFESLGVRGIHRDLTVSLPHEGYYTATMKVLGIT